MFTADRRRKDPIQVPRPASITEARNPKKSAKKMKHGGFLEASKDRGVVRVAGG